MKNKYSETKQEIETRIVTVEEEEATFDQNLAKILLVALTTTILFFLRNS